MEHDLKKHGQENTNAHTAKHQSSDIVQIKVYISIYCLCKLAFILYWNEQKAVTAWKARRNTIKHITINTMPFDRRWLKTTMACDLYSSCNSWNTFLVVSWWPDCILRLYCISASVACAGLPPTGLGLPLPPWQNSNNNMSPYRRSINFNNCIYVLLNTVYLTIVLSPIPFICLSLYLLPLWAPIQSFTTVKRINNNMLQINVFTLGVLQKLSLVWCYFKWWAETKRKLQMCPN